MDKSTKDFIMFHWGQSMVTRGSWEIKTKGPGQKVLRLISRLWIL